MNADFLHKKINKLRIPLTSFFKMTGLSILIVLFSTITVAERIIPMNKKLINNPQKPLTADTPLSLSSFSLHNNSKTKSDKLNSIEDNTTSDTLNQGKEPLGIGSLSPIENTAISKALSDLTENTKQKNPETSEKNLDVFSSFKKEIHSIPSTSLSPSEKKSHSSSLSVSFSGKSNRILILTPGEATRLPLPASYRVYVGQKDLLFLHSEKGSLVITGKKEGQTFLRLKNKVYPVLIVKKELKQSILLVDELLKNFWGLDWSLDQNQIKITGRLNRLYDWMKLAEVAKQNNIPYLFYATLGEGLQEPAEHFFKTLFYSQKENRSLPSPIIQWHNPPIAFIPQDSQDTEEFYQKILKPFGLIPETDSFWLIPALSIQIEVALLETTTNTSMAFGNPAPSSLMDLLNLLLSRGKGRLLHHSSLTAQNNRETTIHSGGQIPLAQYNLETRQQSTRWKSHGLTLKITPHMDKKNTIRLQIRGEISSPFGSHPPSLKTQTFSGVFDVKEGQILKLLHLKKQSGGGYFNGGLSLLPLSAKTDKQNYKMSQVVLLRASILKNPMKTPIEKAIEK